MQKAALFPASGIGDALLMMIAAEQLRLAGYSTTLYHNALPELSTWFPNHDLRPIPEMKEDALHAFDLVIVENDNTAKMSYFLQHHRPKLSIFYPTYKAGKHATLCEKDQRFDPSLSMAENIRRATEKLTQKACSKENGITPPISLKHRNFLSRIVIHPTSSSPQKNWKASRFIHFALQVKKREFSPVFVVSAQERSQWVHVEKEGIPLIVTPTLTELASLVYESGFAIGNDSVLGHLASNLQIPSLVIAEDQERLRLWRPDWLPGKLVFPLRYLPRSIQKKYWPFLISTTKVLDTFFQL